MWAAERKHTHTSYGEKKKKRRIAKEKLAFRTEYYKIAQRGLNILNWLVD